MLKKLLTALPAIIIYSHTLRADAPKYSNEFLSIGLGARALSMGSAATATASDVTAAYWNPALLATLPQRRNAGLMHAEYFAGIASYDFGGFSYKLDSSTTLALSLIRFGVDNIMNTTDLVDKDGNFDYGRIAYFSTADYGIYLSLAKKSFFNRSISVGANAKIIYRNVGKFANAYGFGFDAGACARIKGFDLGLMLQDITTTFNVWTYNASALEVPSYVLPSGDTITNAVSGTTNEVTLPKIALAAAREFQFNRDFSLLAELGLELTADGQRNSLISSKILNIDPKLGLEGSYRKMVFLRFGINNIQRITQFDDKQSLVVQPNMGLGVSLFGFTLDYALTNIGSVGVSSYSHVFSLSYGF
ncbi:MAG: hypothetical protein LBK47_06810 [Prevotellaceae bacterium]|jgi:hypothetical protein|nr:hypothetical protein [Prevotellaceae bacterium]